MNHTDLLQRVEIFLKSRIKPEPSDPQKQIRRNWRFSRFTSHIKIYGEKRTAKDPNILATIHTPTHMSVIIKPTINMAQADRALLHQTILDWTPSLDVAMDD